MAEAHIAALLPTQNRVVSADENTAFLAHYDLNEHDVLRNIKATGEVQTAMFDTTYINPTGSQYSITNTVTMAAWIYPTGVPTGDRGTLIIGTGGYYFTIDTTYHLSTYWYGKSSAGYHNSNGTCPLNTWTHVAVVWDNAGANLYINGVLDKTIASTGTGVAANGLQIGGEVGGTGGRYFKGKINNLGIWSTAKTATEIKSIMANGIIGNEAGLRGFWKMNEGEGTILRDSSAFHQDLVTTNGTTFTWSGGNSVFTLRNVDGYFGGGTIAVEEASSNIITTPHSYPTIGNAWGTYQTNQYNNGNFFSIGTINSVINNEVNITWATGVKFRTYDVVRPQTTGGGLTANTDYFIKMTSDTTFTIHQYDGTQDGSKGFSVHDPIKNDVRIAINATSFPTMWYGAPHKPNSGLVKEVISNGFTNNGVTHDCLRMYTNYADQTQAWTDYMAYGVGPAMTASTAYTVSFYYRAVTPETIGRVVNYQMHNGAGFGYGTFTLQRDWQRYEAVVTPSVTGACSLYWNAGKGVVWDIAEIQLEQRSSATSFMTTSRPAGNLLYPNPIPNATEFTVAFWMKKTGNAGGTAQQFLCIDQGQNVDGMWIDEYGTTLRAFIYPTDGSAATISTTSTYNISQWTHIAFVANQTQQTFYVNGVPVHTIATKPFKMVGQLSIAKRLSQTANANILIDELRIDKVARTDADISAWYYSASPFWPRGIYRKTY